MAISKLKKNEASLLLSPKNVSKSGTFIPFDSAGDKTLFIFEAEVDAELQIFRGRNLEIDKNFITLTFKAGEKKAIIVEDYFFMVSKGEHRGTLKVKASENKAIKYQVVVLP